MEKRNGYKKCALCLDIPEALLMVPLHDFPQFLLSFPKVMFSRPSFRILQDPCFRTLEAYSKFVQFRKQLEKNNFLEDYEPLNKSLFLRCLHAYLKNFNFRFHYYFGHTSGEFFIRPDKTEKYPREATKSLFFECIPTNIQFSSF